MSSRKIPTSVLLNNRNKLRDAVFVACREGRIHDLKKLKKKFTTACEIYASRHAEDIRIAMEKEERKRKRMERHAKK